MERVNAQSGNGDNNGGKWPECGLCSLHPMDLLSEARGSEEGRQPEAVTILISHSQEDSDHFEDVPAVPVQVTKMQMDVSF